MSSGDQSVDRLYQAPLNEFTAARNELAKTSGADGAVIKALEKPSAPAWAVNQLYWRERRVFERLVRTTERLRSMHAALLTGRKADVRTVEVQHRAAVKDAADRARELLQRAGDPATAATMKAVLETLQALPVPGKPGRLAKPIQQVGFGSFAQLMKGASLPKSAAEVVVLRPQKPAALDREAAEKAAKRKERAEAEKRVTALLAAERASAAALKQTRATLARTEKERQALDERLQSAVEAAQRLQNDIERLERERRAAEKERLQIERKLDS